MVNRLMNALSNVLLRRKDYTDDELNRYVLMLGVAVAACGVHVVFSIFFFIVGSVPLAISHVVGVFVFVLCYFLLQKRKYDLTGVLLCVMIMISSMATIYSIGGDNFSVLYQVLVLMILMIVPFENRKIPLVGSILLPPLMILSYFIDLLHVAPYDIGVANNVLSVLNLIIVPTGVVVLLSLERLVRSFIDGFKERRIEELQDQAYLDPLTGLYNRRYADIYFANLRETVPQRNISVAIADIDDFKLINDRYGHDAGDSVLKLISDVFTQSTRKSDLAFRWGGEEFLIIIHDASMADTKRILDNIRKTIEESCIYYDEQSLHVTITMGAAPLDSHNVAESLRECDRKLYAGKNTTKNVVIL